MIAIIEMNQEENNQGNGAIDEMILSKGYGYLNKH